MRRGGPHGTKEAENRKPDIKAMRRLLKYLGNNRKLVYFAIFLSFVTTAITIFSQYAIKPILELIERALRQEITLAQMNQWIGIWLVVLATIFLIEIVATYIISRIMLKVTQDTAYGMRKDLYAHLNRTSVAYHDRHLQGDLLSRFSNDMASISQVLGDTLVSFFSNFALLIGTLIVMFIISWPLALVVVGLLPIMLFLIQKIGTKARATSKSRQKALGMLNGYIEEAMEGNMVNQVFNRNPITLEEMNEKSMNFTQKSYAAQGYGMLMMPLMQNLNHLIYAVSGIVGGLLAIDGYLTIGGLGAFINMSRAFGRPLNMLANQYTQLLSALAAASRVFEVLDEPLETVNDPQAVLSDVSGEVRFDRVNFSYVEGTLVLKDVTFWAKVNQKIALVGSTGAGKTTITNLITRFYDIDSGQITIDGIDIKTINRYSLRENIAMVLQDTHLITGTIMDNIRYGRLDATDEEVIEAAKLANADSFIQHLPQGYETIIAGSGEGLSQGQQQLINIARAAVANPKILILDEATSSIDTRTEELVEKGMDRLMENRTTFVIAHRLSTVRNADAILVIENGEIIERGDHDDLCAQNGRYAALVSHQHGALS